jgi:hypothetical protein
MACLLDSEACFCLGLAAEPATAGEIGHSPHNALRAPVVLLVLLDLKRNILARRSALETSWGG